MAASAVSSGASGPGSGGGGGNTSTVRLRRGSTSFDDSHRNGSFSSNATLNAADLNAHTAANASSTPPARYRRRSSNFSDYSQDARDLLNPTPMDASAESLRHSQPTSKWDSLPLAFALLPAVGGLLVQGGSAFLTDLMLLGLGAIFLHWSVTQPWAWYHSAQQIREENDTSAEFAIHGDSDAEDDLLEDDVVRSSTPVHLEDVQEEDEDEEKGTGKEGGGKDKINTGEGESSLETNEKQTGESPSKKPTPTADERVAAYNRKQRERHKQERRRFQARQAAALRELYRHEVLALLSCFVCPIVGAYLLHALRAQLTRPSEGLISNYNLTIFILGAEVRPLRHLLQLVRARTLHLQRVVHINPYREEEEQYRERRAEEEKVQNQTLTDLVRRLDRLEEEGANAAKAVAATAAAAAGRPLGPNQTSYFPSPGSHPPSPPSPTDAPGVNTGTPTPTTPGAGGGAISSRRRSGSATTTTTDNTSTTSAATKRAERDRADRLDRDALLRDVRAALQQELDTLARALRRTHKQQALLEGQVAARLRATDQRLSDAVSLAAGTSSPSSRRRSSPYSRYSYFSPGYVVDEVGAALVWALDALLAAALYVPRKVLAAAVALPVWVVQAVFGSGGSGGKAGRSSSKKSTTSGSSGGGGRTLADKGGKTGSRGAATNGAGFRTSKKGSDAKMAAAARDYEYDYEYVPVLAPPSAPSPSRTARQYRLGAA